MMPNAASGGAMSTAVGQVMRDGPSSDSTGLDMEMLASEGFRAEDCKSSAVVKV